MSGFFALLGLSEGASIGHNTAYIKPFWIKARRAPKGAPFTATIVVDGMQLANPAAIIYECMTNQVWGMGAPDSLLDQTSFSDAADALVTEGFGLGMLWHKQQSIEEFVGVVLDHIEATLALDPFTGLMRLKLIRDDYDVEDLPVFGPHNATLENFERKAWGETINEINVSWTSPVNEQTETVTVHDTASIDLQGGTIVSETRDYFGIRTAALALRVATRDLLAASSALASAKLTVNRSAWRVLPGDVIALSWPDYGFASIPMRVGEVDYGAPGDSEISLSVIEDVFGMPQQSYVTSDGTAWVNPSAPPQALTYEHLTSAPYFAVAKSVGDTGAQAVSETSDFDLGFGTTALRSTFSFDMVEQVSDANGNLTWQTQDNVDLAGRGLLPAPLVPETTSLIASFDSPIRVGNAVAGALLWIGPIDNTGELALIQTVDGTGYTVARGVLDTVPGDWPAGTAVWMLHGSVIGSTKVERALGENPVLRYLTRTNQGRLGVADAADVTATMSGRLHLPYRPAAFAVDGVLFPAEPPLEPVTLTWAGRNRLEETALINSWDDGSVTPEAGTTYTLEIDALEGDGTLIQASYRVVTGITAETFDLDTVGNEPPDGTGKLGVRLYAVRDGLKSWQPAYQEVGVFHAAYNLEAIFIPD